MEPIKHLIRLLANTFGDLAILLAFLPLDLRRFRRPPRDDARLGVVGNLSHSPVVVFGPVAPVVFQAPFANIMITTLQLISDHLIGT